MCFLHVRVLLCVRSGLLCWSDRPGLVQVLSVDCGVDAKVVKWAPCPGACGPDAGLRPGLK